MQWEAEMAPVRSYGEEIHVRVRSHGGLEVVYREKATACLPVSNARSTAMSRGWHCVGFSKRS
jgi:hypothetical protein